MKQAYEKLLSELLASFINFTEWVLSKFILEWKHLLDCFKSHVFWVLKDILAHIWLVYCMTLLSAILNMCNIKVFVMVSLNWNKVSYVIKDDLYLFSVQDKLNPVNQTNILSFRLCVQYSPQGKRFRVQYSTSHRWLP